ncbi:MAG: hypothetical protein NT120_04795 [Candidatus Aenigmarchaeota archaeon]|nr:hypothetical protein [Candidatus Aenigmarchaeota archaeon]
MTFSNETLNTMLAVELENLRNRENEMYKFYTELAKEVNDQKIKEKLKFIRDQELGHIKMATSLMSILDEYIRQG